MSPLPHPPPPTPHTQKGASVGSLSDSNGLTSVGHEENKWKMIFVVLGDCYFLLFSFWLLQLNLVYLDWY